MWNRRDLLKSAGAGFGAVALDALFAGEVAGNDAAPGGRLHHPAKAKAVIVLCMFGGPSAIDLFDPKPALATWHGKTMPGFDANDSFFADESKGLVMQSPYTFKRYGQSGMDFCERLPRMAALADEWCMVRSMHCDNNNHRPAILQANTGFTRAGYPSLGSWVSYGLGSGNANLPGYVVMLDPVGGPFGGALNWGTGFMPAAWQGVPLRAGAEPIADLAPYQGMPPERQRARLDLLARINQRHAQAHPEDSALSARLDSYELAWRMQKHAPEAVDLAQESAATRTAYGLDDKPTEAFGRQCLLARRLVERGVRFVQIYSGGGNPMGSNGWDGHSAFKANHDARTAQVDRPTAALIADLKARGLLDSTLVIWGGEFGRLPVVQGKDGRDHNINGYTMLLCGGGVRRGLVYGATDEFGYRAVDHRVHLHDLHATVLHLLGLDHTRLTWPHSGRAMRLTDVSGEVVKGIIA